MTLEADRPMTVAELIEKLHEMPQGATVQVDFYGTDYVTVNTVKPLKDRWMTEPVVYIGHD